MKIALLQMTSGIDPAVNARVVTEAIAEAAAGGAGVLFTPEMTGLLDRDRARAAFNIVEEGADTVLAAARDAAWREKIWVQLGSLALREDDRLVNRGFVIDDAGEVRARYDKLHLFDVDLPTGESWRESAAYRAGEGASVVETPAGPLGLSICYDLRFPDLYRALSDAGATILAVPSAFTRPTGQAIGKSCSAPRDRGGRLCRRGGADRHARGRPRDPRPFAGDRSVGEVLLDMGEAPGVGFAEIDPARVADVRARIPALKHRRAIPAVTRA